MLFRSRQCVFCASPNLQDTNYFDNNDSGSVTRSWDNTIIEADMCYGKEWHMKVVQAINDPFWQAPDASCAVVTQEAYPCEAAIDTYKYPPLVEPLNAIPSGDSPTPTLPADVTLNPTETMPTAVGVAYCVSEPRERATPHKIRAAWLDCDDWKDLDRKSTRLNSSHVSESRMPSSA